MVNEEQQKLMYEIAVYREQINLLQREMDRITLATLDLSNASRTTEKLSTGETLVPIGGGAFVRAKVETSRILVPIGVGYLAEMERGEAEAEVKKRIDATEKAIERLGEEFRTLSKKLHDASAKLKEMETQLALSKKVDENIGEDYL